MKACGSSGVRQNFPSFWEGLSLRHVAAILDIDGRGDFPSFWEGLSLRHHVLSAPSSRLGVISLPFGRDFH